MPSSFAADPVPNALESGTQFDQTLFFQAGDSNQFQRYPDGMPQDQERELDRIPATYDHPVAENVIITPGGMNSERKLKSRKEAGLFGSQLVNQSNLRGAQNSECMLLQSQTTIHIHIVNEKSIIIKTHFCENA